MQDKVTETQVAIIGGGIIGAAIARELSKYKVDVCLLEKEPGIGFGITKGSLGLLHSALGLSASKLVKWWDRSGDAKAYLSKPLRKKERLNIIGREMFLDLAPQLGAAIHQCGRIMVAKDEAELRILEVIRQVAEEKTGTRLDLLDKKGLQEKEPEIDSKFIGGLYDPYEYSVFPTEWAIAFAENAKDNGVHILLETEISAIEEKKDHFKLKTNYGTIDAQFVINSAGLFSDDIAKMIDKIDWSFVLWKSQLMIIENKGYLRHTLSEVLTPQLPRIMVPTPEGNDEHEEILLAIKQGDRERAGALMEKHLDYVSIVPKNPPHQKKLGRKARQGALTALLAEYDQDRTPGGLNEEDRYL